MNGIVEDYIKHDWVKVSAVDQETAEGYAEMIITLAVKDIWKAAHEAGLSQGYKEGFEDGKNEERKKLMGAINQLKEK